MPPAVRDSIRLPVPRDPYPPATSVSPWPVPALPEAKAVFVTFKSSRGPRSAPRGRREPLLRCWRCLRPLRSRAVAGCAGCGPCALSAVPGGRAPGPGPPAAPGISGVPRLWGAPPQGWDVPCPWGSRGERSPRLWRRCWSGRRGGWPIPPLWAALRALWALIISLASCAASVHGFCRLEPHRPPCMLEVLLLLCC